MNILFLGGAKRVSMARLFKAVEPDIKLYSYELSERVPIAIEAEIIIGKRWGDPELDIDLRRIILEKEIDIVIPFVDGAIEPAARLKDIVFAPCCHAETFTDKILCDIRLRELGLPVPQRRGLKCIAKPRLGAASQGLIVFEGECKVDESEYLVQEYIERRREITVDCYVAVSEICACVPRERLEVSGGEVTRTRTFHSQRVSKLAREVLAKTGLQGAVTVQLIEDLDSGRLMVMEINPRLGGGAVCSVAAGANIPEMIIHQAKGLKVEPIKDYKDIEMARYSAELFFE